MLRRFVRRELVCQHKIYGFSEEEVVRGLIWESIMLSACDAELDWLDWDAAGVLSLLEGTLSWMDISMVISYSGYAVYVPSWRFICGGLCL